MAKKQLNEWDKAHQKQMELYARRIRAIYKEAAKEAAALGVSLTDFNPDNPFSFADYPITQKRIDKLLKTLKNNVATVIINGIDAEWTLANNKNSELANQVFGKYAKKLTAAQRQKYYSNNSKALETFLKRKENGLNLSDRVWKYTDQFKNEIEMALDLGLRDRLSAIEMTRDLQDYLRNPNKLFRRVRDEHGQLHLSKNAKAYHPGQGVYRSSYKNALRLSATETNIAYRTSDYLRWQQLDFIVGMEIRLSNNHPVTDICDTLAGKYPKDFKFTGWHPFCYDDKSEVLTENGWQHFKDVTIDDKVLSLNPETRQCEWVNVILSFGREYKGQMIHFHNRSLDCMVTPEHEMVYLNKSDGRIKRCSAHDYTKGKGAFYRGCKWSASKREEINIDGKTLPFGAFCKFMAYWLSDGSLIRDYQITIAQQYTDKNCANIIEAISDMGFKVSQSKDKINFYSKELNGYLKQFGLCNEKYIPTEIKNASCEQIQLFLDAYISCDGHIRPARSFIGNKGSVCNPESDERVYFTTSKQMASDLGELILKTGKRPSYYINKTKGKKQDFKNGTYTINHDVHIINECKATTATVFNKAHVDYDGLVYDVTLSKNAIMYVRRNGKCFWGSNCRCHAISILKTPEEMQADNERILNGETLDNNSTNKVSDVPDQFKKWASDNQQRISSAKALPYFVRDNEKYFSETTITFSAMKGVKQAQELNKELIKKATKQHFDNSIDEAKSVDDVKNILKERLKAQLNYDINVQMNEKYLSLDVAKIYAKKLSSLVSEYKVEQLEFGKFTTRQYVNSYGFVKTKGKKDKVGKIIWLPKEMNVGQAVANSRVSDVATYKSLCEAKNLQISTLTHEFAHNIAQSSIANENDVYAQFFKEIKDIRTSYLEELSSYLGNKEKFNSVYLGEYSLKNIDEFYAEAFQEYKNKKTPSKYAKLVGELTDKYFKK